MTQPADLVARRKRNGCATETTPEELLRIVLDEVRAGRVKLDRLIVCGVTDQPEDETRLHYWVGGCGVGGALEIATALQYAVSQNYFGDE